MTLTQVDSQTKTAAFTGAGIDISGITGDWTLKINVQSLADASTTPVVRLSFEDTVNDYTASLAGPTVSFKGALSNNADKVKSFKKQDFPDLRLGTSSAQLRLKLSNIESGGSCNYRAWLEY
jgi:hypothetical protein